MGHSVELSDELVLDARAAGELMDRSVAEQIEFWAGLGRVIDALLDGSQIAALRRAGAVRRLSECLATIDSDVGRQRVAEYLASLPFPHYEAAPDAPGLLIRIDEDGTRTRGRFVDRQFHPQ